MFLIEQFIREKDLQKIIARLFNGKSVDTKKVFTQELFSILVDEGIKDLSGEEKEHFLLSVSDMTQNVISERNKPEDKNPDYMCC